MKPASWRRPSATAVVTHGRCIAVALLLVYFAPCAAAAHLRRSTLRSVNSTSLERSQNDQTSSSRRLMNRASSKEKEQGNVKEKEEKKKAKEKEEDEEQEKEKEEEKKKEKEKEAEVEKKQEEKKEKEQRQGDQPGPSSFSWPRIENSSSGRSLDEWSVPSPAPSNELPPPHPATLSAAPSPRPLPSPVLPVFPASPVLPVFEAAAPGPAPGAAAAPVAAAMVAPAPSTYAGAPHPAPSLWSIISPVTLAPNKACASCPLVVRPSTTASPATTRAPPPAPAEPSGPLKTTLVKRLRDRGEPSCRQFPKRACAQESMPVAPACTKGVSTLSRSSTVANWFYLYLKRPSFVLDLASGCRGLQSTLPPGIQYVPASQFLPSCNYNEGFIPQLKDSMAKDMSGVVVALGVLEQLCDVPSFLEALKTYYRPLVVSYAPVDTRDADVSNRVNRLTSAQWRKILHNLNLDKASHQARVHLNGVPNLVYWFEPSDWTPFAG